MSIFSNRCPDITMHRALATAVVNKPFSREFYGRLLFSTGTQTLSPSANSSQRNPQNLPQLPVPQLTNTLGKYLKTVKPFLNEVEFQTTKKLVEEFHDGIGAELQKFLINKAKSTENWLESWWLNNAYLKYRDPVVVYSSPGLVFPFQAFQTEEDRLNYTTELILAALDYKLLIDSNKMPTDMMGKDALDMNQYRKIFGTCRIPGIEQDSLEFHSNSSHIVVAHNNQFFKINVLNKGQVINKKNLLALLEDVLKQSPTRGESIGVLTAEHRDNWGKAYQLLIKDPQNAQSVTEIQQSLFLVSLDNPMPIVSNENRQTTASKQFIHGGGSGYNSGNRWYDKTVQFVIGKDGTVGLTYEHSPSEGQPIAVMTDYMVNFIKNGKSTNEGSFTADIEKLPFTTNKELNEAINKANLHIDKLAGNLDLYSTTFKGYGKEFIKSQKLSPDSFIQMAMQYAFYRIHKVPAAHYESAATRKYIHGRTETIRSCSIESIDFAKAMLDSNKNNAEKLAALKAAVQSHKQYTVEAINGFGVDRHLLGLKLAALEQGLKVPPLYSDPGFTRSAHMRMSTSQVATNCDGFMCYGPLVDNGYGCCYNPRHHDMNFAVSTFTGNSETDARNYFNNLAASLEDMQNLLIHTQKSKL